MKLEDQSITAEVIKRGEVCIRIGLNRGPQGLIVSIKTHPQVEDFMRSISSDQKVNVELISRHWSAISRDKPELLAYAIPDLEQTKLDDSFYVSMTNLGSPLILNDKPGAKGINLSFLRLVGTSEGRGVQFGLKQVMSFQAMKSLEGVLAKSARQFYINYLRPINLSISIVTQELQL